jgi:predicted small metal-binding protein
MDKVLHCNCGFQAQNEDEDGLASEVRRHAWEAHGMALTRDDALLIIARAEPHPPTTIPRQPTGDE